MTKRKADIPQNQIAPDGDQTGTENNGEGSGDTDIQIVDAEPVAPNEAEDAAQEQAASDDDEEQTTDQTGQETLPTGIDAEAPYGRFANGNPRKAPKIQAAKQARDQQRNRLRSVTQSSYKPKGPQPGKSTVTALTLVNYQAMGDTAANLFFNVGEMTLGADWAPNVAEGEPQAISGAFRDYFKAINAKDLPPGFALVAVLAIYTLKRTNKPTVKNKLALAGGWIKDRMPRRRGLYPVPNTTK